VPLSGDDDNIAAAAASSVDVMALRAIVLHTHGGGARNERAAHASNDVRDDSPGSSVRGLSSVDHDVVGKLRRNRAHQRALADIAIAATTEHDVQPRPTMHTCSAQRF